MKEILYEWCPHCETEIHMPWDIKTQGFLTKCPACGHRLLFCGECDANCDYDHRTNLCLRVVEAMWEALADIPLEPSENIEEYLAESITLYGISFPAGTTQTELWQWFDRHHPKGVAYLLYEKH